MIVGNRSFGVILLAGNFRSEMELFVKHNFLIIILLSICATCLAEPVNLLCIENGAKIIDYSPTEWGDFQAAFDSFTDLETSLFCSEFDTPFPHFFTYELAITAEISAVEFNNETEEIAYPGISAKGIRVYTAASRADSFKLAAAFELAPNVAGQHFEMVPVNARLIKFEIISNHGFDGFTELEKVKALGVFKTLPTMDSITGVWLSSFGEMKIPRTEPFVTGCFEDGTLHGIFANRVLSFYWTEDQQHGIVSAILNEEADALIGFWGSENNTYEVWTASLSTNRIFECPEDPVVFQLNASGETLLFNFQTQSLPDTTDFETQAILAGAIKFLTANPDKKLTIESFIHSDEESASEKALAELWSLRVKKFFTARGIADGRLEIRGTTESRPLADTATVTGKSLNQRIRLRVQ